jgi:hypothetical protein
MYSNSGASSQCRMAIIKNDTFVAIGGAAVANSTALTCLDECVIGDQLSVVCQIGSNVLLFMLPYHSIFSGFLVFFINTPTIYVHYRYIIILLCL